MQTSSQLFVESLIKLVRPLVRMAIRYGLTYNTFNELVNRLYVEEAGNQLRQEGKKQTIAHISVLPGINQKSTKSIMERPQLE